MRLLDEVKLKRDDIYRASSKYGATNIRVFGSVARGEDDDFSDIDLLVDLEPGRSLFDLGGLLSDLKSILHHEVDVTTVAGLKSRIKDRVLRESIPL